MKTIESIFKFIESKRITNSEFEQKSGVSNGYLRNIAKSNSQVSSKMLSKMFSAYPDLEKYITQLEKKEEALPLPSPGNAVRDNNAGNVFYDLGNGMYLMTTPLVHEYAYGGYTRGFADPEYLEELPKHGIMVTSLHKGVYRTFIMRGESMDDGSKDAIEPGYKLTGRLLSPEHWRSRLHINKYKEWIIHTVDGVIVKEIIRHDVENGIITIRSRNPDKEMYPDENINLADCKELYSVVEISKPRKD